MNPNPFSPSFAILPSSFFGRTAYIEHYATALDTPNSAYRFFFLTGTRGSGKTSLLHQYELQARERRWDTIKATNIDLLDRLFRYVGLDREGSTVRSLKPSVAIPSLASISLGELSTESAIRQPSSLLSDLLIQKLKGLRTRRGLAIIVDEAQKLKAEDAVLVLHAMQDARLQGLDVSLVLCGLPNAYQRVRAMSDITFARRMKRKKLWTMTKQETLAFLQQSFAALPEIGLTSDQLYGIGSFSGGHPYLLQLLGDNIYHLVEDEYDPFGGMVIPISNELIARAETRSLMEYRDNVLNDVLRGVHPNTRDYLHTAFLLRDEHGRISVSNVSNELGKSARELASTRAAALNTQIVKVAGHGYLRFALPHYEYIFNAFEFEEPETVDDEWEF
ncbi:MAG: ATP-binding protein [Coriobacteriales bacterium]|nr:ATP-binding protein [Coriobacteriales bacterium]